ncbi:unnamed protein product, partial [Meganyctiphanes norvegica]
MPSLRGHCTWETAAWFIVQLNKDYRAVDYGFASRHLSTWIEHVISDADICPSPYLRIELIHLYLVMVGIHEHNWLQALGTVMTALSDINFEYLNTCCSGSNTEYHRVYHRSQQNNKYQMYEYFFNVNLKSITLTLNKFSKYGRFMSEFDEQLSNELKNNINLRKSNIIRDVACNQAIHPSRYTGPLESNALIALLNVTAGSIRLATEDIPIAGAYLSLIMSRMNHLFDTVHVLFRSFGCSIQMYQIMDSAASCIMDLVELVLLYNSALIDKDEYMYHSGMVVTNNILQTVLFKQDSYLDTSPMRKYLVAKYSHGCLRKLRGTFEGIEYELEKYPRILDLLGEGEIPYEDQKRKFPDEDDYYIMTLSQNI